MESVHAAQFDEATINMRSNLIANRDNTNL